MWVWKKWEQMVGGDDWKVVDIGLIILFGKKVVNFLYYL